jgi:hypothetical protein
MKQFLLSLLSSEWFQGLIGAGLAALMGWLTTQIHSAVWKRRFANLAHMAFFMVEDEKAEAEKEGRSLPALEKSSLLLAKLDELAVLHGWRKPKDGERQMALKMASAIHGAQKVAALVSPSGDVYVTGSPN